jgi:CheY-like chemotaxis protein
MNKNGPIIVIEDDEEDQEILLEIFDRLPYKNKVVFFTNGNEVIEYINTPGNDPFLILSDINMPNIDGFELRKKVFSNKDLQNKCVPYLFFTNGTHKKAVVDAYAMSVQGFFIKPSNLSALENTIRKIMDYWQECIAPNQFD